MEFRESDWLGPEELTRDVGSLRAILRDLTELQEKGGKIFLDKLLRSRYNAIMAGIAMAPLPSLDAALVQEYEKGRAIECLYQEQLVQNLIEVYKERIQEITEATAAEEEYDGE